MHGTGCGPRSVNSAPPPRSSASAVGGVVLVGLDVGIAVVLQPSHCWPPPSCRPPGPLGPGRSLHRSVPVPHGDRKGVVALVCDQLTPAGRSHSSNPAVTREPQWADPQARELMVRACYGCHSNEVEWPWYSNVAPMSWAISDHVDEGREKVNYSEFDRPQEEAGETIEVILEGSMPPILLHPIRPPRRRQPVTSRDRRTRRLAPPNPGPQRGRGQRRRRNR